MNYFQHGTKKSYKFPNCKYKINAEQEHAIYNLDIRIQKQRNTKFGATPRATTEPPMAYSSIRAQPIIQATLQSIREITLYSHTLRQHI